MRYIRMVSLDGGPPRAPNGEHNAIVVNQFNQKWEHPTPKPTVTKVLFRGMIFLSV
jgi:hypothetical protein